ncbi:MULTISPECIES: YwdI family protein [Bacillus]|uniref:YwdI family protein n=1 Tax=Bacillus TaxID=1386 RepID=UPI000BB71302|nr:MULTISPECIES: YwdI family protein [Bacillus]
MDIPLNKVLQQIQAETEKALQTNSAQEKREHLTAIKALSELALQTKSSSDQQPVYKPTPMPTPPVNFATNVQPVTPVPSVKRNEPDANGDSLFDF